MSMTGADYIAQALHQAGVKRVYGVVGDSLNGFTDALRRLEKIEWIHVRNEEGAAFAAGAEAHLTGERAVCAGSCGPGNLGVKGIRVERPQTLRGAVVEALKHDGPALVEVMSTRQELVMPPVTTAEEAQSFGLFLMKAVLDGRARELIDLTKTALLR